MTLERNEVYLMNGLGTRQRISACSVVVALALGITGVIIPPAARALAPIVLVAVPLTGPVGTSVVITGSGFDDSSVATEVAFNGTAAVFTVDSDTQITTTVPVGATTGPVSVTDAQGTGATVLDFVVIPSPPPTIVLVQPSSGPAGTSVTITGTGHTGATSVLFNGTAATFDAVSDIETPRSSRSRPPPDRSPSSRPVGRRRARATSPCCLPRGTGAQWSCASAAAS